MRRMTSAFMVGFVVAICGILWITQRKGNQKAPAPPALSPSVPPPMNRRSHMVRRRQARKRFTRTPPEETGKKWRLRAINWATAALLMGISLCLLGTWFYNLVTNIRSLPSAPRGFDQAATVPIVSRPSLTDGVSTLPSGMELDSASSKAHGVLLFNISQIKSETPTTGTFTGTFDLYVPSDLQAAICDSSRVSSVLGDRAGECPGRGSIAVKRSVSIQFLNGDQQANLYPLKPEYASRVLTLTVERHFADNSSTSTPLFSTTFPLKTLFLPSSYTSLPPSGAYVSVGLTRPSHLSIPATVTLPLFSQGQAYPDDWYVADVSVLITLPPPLYIPDSLSGSGAIFYLPVDLRIVASTGLSNYTMKLLPGVTGVTFIDSIPKGASGPNLLVLKATRNDSSKWLIYSTALLIPIGLLLLLGHALFIWKREEKEPLYNIWVNVLIAALTVIAVRQVLVPSDLQGILTRLDLFLATGGISLLVLIFVKYVCQLVRR